MLEFLNVMKMDYIDIVLYDNSAHITLFTVVLHS